VVAEHIAGMERIIVLTGTLGSGKTTVAKLLAGMLANGVHVESDVFYRFFSHPIAPHLVAAGKQNEAAIAAACQTARSLCVRGYPVVLEGILGPWFLPLISSELGPEITDRRYIVLRTSIEEALRRVRLRGDGTRDEVVAAMHPQFSSLGDFEQNVVDTTRLRPRDVVDELLAGLSAGRFRLSLKAAPQPRGTSEDRGS
jgi:cytidylate kinase